MNMSGASPALVAYLVVLSMISFGGIPAMLPNLRDYVVASNGWITDQDFANCFAVVQAIPGPNMILMMSFIGWKVGGLPIAIASGFATFVPPCAISFVVFRYWERFREASWQGPVRRGLAPVTIGLVIAGGYVMAQASNVGWVSVAVTVAAAGLLLLTRVNPLWMLGAGAALGGLGLL
jgi:chromate transporter